MYLSKYIVSNNRRLDPKRLLAVVSLLRSFECILFLGQGLGGSQWVGGGSLGLASFIFLAFLRMRT